MLRYAYTFLLLLLMAGTLPLAAQVPADSTLIDSTVVDEEADELTEADSVDTEYEAEKADRDTATYAAANDQTPVQVRRLDADRLNDIRTSRDYQYGTDVPPTASLWDRIWAWFWMKIGELLRTKAYRNVGQYVLLVVIAALVIWLLYKADVLTRLFPGRARNLPLAYETLDEDIHAIDFSTRINEAVEQRNYRLAVRLLYLQTLKRLTDRGLIQWQPNKTNRQYTYELTGNPARLPFEQLTTQFEYVWYGDFPVDEARFGQIREKFNQFNG
jgi:hypothetical protein